MDVTFVANDTRGGVEPYLALAVEAVKRGHTVRAAAPEDHEEDLHRAGVRFVPLRGVNRAAIAARSDRSSLREMSRQVAGLVPAWATAVRELSRGTDLIVSGLGGMGLARPVAASLGLPLLRAHLQPIEAPSSQYPGPLASSLDVAGPLGRRVSHALTRAGTEVLLRAPERAARDALGSSIARADVLPKILYGFSPAVVNVTSDARTQRIATGYWSVAADGAGVPPELERFIAAAPDPVVSVGFGSMVAGDPERLSELVVRAVTGVGVRAVLLSGWGGLTGASSSAHVFVATSVPHRWLFPRMAATVHHGGAGTTGAALTAGVPTFVVPFGAEQPFWGRRAQALGVSPRPIPRVRLTADTLSRAIDRMLHDAAMQERAASLGATLRGEPGTAGAVDHIEALR